MLGWGGYVSCAGAFVLFPGVCFFRAFAEEVTLKSMQPAPSPFITMAPDNVPLVASETSAGRRWMLFVGAFATACLLLWGSTALSQYVLMPWREMESRSALTTGSKDSGEPAMIEAEESKEDMTADAS